MRVAPSRVAHVFAIAAAIALTGPSLWVQYGQHLYGIGFPYGLFLAALLLSAAHYVVLLTCFRFSEVFSVWSLGVRSAANLCFALLGAMAVSLMFLPLFAIFKAVRLTLPVPKLVYLTEQHLQELALSPITISGVILLVPLLVAAMLVHSQLVVQQRLRGENAL
jgi:hypothetical protein